MSEPIYQTTHNLGRMNAGTSRVVRHGLVNGDGEPVIPNFVLPDTPVSIRATVDDTNVTYQNIGSTPVTGASFYVEYRLPVPQATDPLGTLIYQGDASAVTGSGGGCSVLDYGADPTGAANSLTAFQDAVNACTDVYVPPGTYLISGGSIRLHENSSLIGAGYMSHLTCDTDDAVVYTVNGDGTKPSHITIAGFRISHTNTLGNPPLQGDSDGVLLWGTDIEVRDVWFEQCFRAVELRDFPSNTNGNIRLVRISARHSNPLTNTSSFGLVANQVYGLYVEDCTWRDAWLDGIKLLKLCTVVRIRGGESSANGRGFGFGTSGDGIDMFAGGEDVVIENTAMEDNGGSGVVIKTVGNSVVLGEDFNPPFGWQRSISLRAMSIRRNKGAGVAIEPVHNSTSPDLPRLADAGEDNRPRASTIRIDDCVIEYNELQGIICNGFRVSIRGGVFRTNFRHGIEIWEDARDIDIYDVDLLGNSWAGAGTYPAINVRAGAARVRFRRVRMNGKDHSNGVEIVDDSSYAALTTYHRNGIEVEDGASPVEVLDCTNEYVTSDPFDAPVVCFGANDRVLVHHSGTTQATANGRYYGCRGSLYRSQEFGSDGTSLWIKESNANVRTGWVGVWGRKHYAQISARSVVSNLTCTLANTYYRIIAFDTDGPEYGAEAQAAPGRRIVIAPAGIYRIDVEVRWNSDVGETWEFAVEADLVPIPGCVGYGEALVGAQPYNTQFSWIAALSLNDIIELYVRNPINAAEVIQITDVMMRVTMVDKTGVP
jgi:hypothetical protein